MEVGKKVTLSVNGRLSESKIFDIRGSKVFLRTDLEDIIERDMNEVMNAIQNTIGRQSV